MDFFSWGSMTKFKHLGSPFLLPGTSTPSLMSPVSHLVILSSEGKLPVYLVSTIYQALHIILILKATLWERSHYPIFITKETGPGRLSVQHDTLVNSKGRESTRSVIPRSMTHATWDSAVACCPLPAHFSHMHLNLEYSAWNAAPTTILHTLWFWPHLQHFLHGWFYQLWDTAPYRLD